MSVASRLRELDRRVLKDGGPTPTPEQWRRNARMWRVGAAVVLVGTALLFGLALVTGSAGVSAGALPGLLLVAFYTGYLKCEDDRLRGKRFFGAKRPDGV